MIDGKRTILLHTKNVEDEEEVRKLVREVTGRDEHLNCLSEDKRQEKVVELTIDLTEAKIFNADEYGVKYGSPCNRKYKWKTIKEFVEYYKNEYLILRNLAIVKHIPHASIELPEPLEKEDNYFRTDVTKCILKMADIGVDKLFKFIKGIEVKAPYTRVFCDVERYMDNSKEPMSKYGQGYIYTKTYDGKDIHHFMPGQTDYDWVSYINIYYINHHINLTNAVKSQLDRGKDVLLLDLHSYSDELADSIGNKGPYPDICIGINDDFDNESLLNLVINKIKEKGYTYQINFPYKGSIMPQNLDMSKYKNKLTSIMIEVNKRLYL